MAVQAGLMNLIDAYTQVLIRAGIQPDLIVLFGSQVSGKATADSDVDLAVFSRQVGADRIQASKRLVLLKFDVNHRIAPIAYPVEAIQNADPGSFLHDEVLRKGIIVWPRERRGEPAVRVLRADWENSK